MHDVERFGATPLSVSSRVWEYARDHQPFAESVLGVATGRVNLARGGEARFVPAVYLSGTGMAALGVEPAVGRVVEPQDDTPTSPPVAMISYGLWQRDYTGDAGVLGQTLWVDNQPFTIVGVAPPSFFGLEVGQQAEVMLPLAGDDLIRRSAGTSRRPDTAVAVDVRTVASGPDAQTTPRPHSERGSPSGATRRCLAGPMPRLIWRIHRMPLPAPAAIPTFDASTSSHSSCCSPPSDWCW